MVKRPSQKFVVMMAAVANSKLKVAEYNKTEIQYYWINSTEFLLYLIWTLGILIPSYIIKLMDFSKYVD